MVQYDIPVIEWDVVDKFCFNVFFQTVICLVYGLMVLSGIYYSKLLLLII